MILGEWWGFKKKPPLVGGEGLVAVHPHRMEVCAQRGGVRERPEARGARVRACEVRCNNKTKWETGVNPHQVGGFAAGVRAWEPLDRSECSAIQVPGKEK